MIYLDTSVVLAQLLGEGRAPDAAFWESELVSSRLLEYELWNRLNARGLVASHGDAVRGLLARMVMRNSRRRSWRARSRRFLCPYARWMGCTLPRSCI